MDSSITSKHQEPRPNKKAVILRRDTPQLSASPLAEIVGRRRSEELSPVKNSYPLKKTKSSKRTNIHTTVLLRQSQKLTMAEEQVVDIPQEEIAQEEFEVVSEPVEVKFVELATAIPADVQQAQAEIKLFNKWSFAEVTVKDISLTDYIQITKPTFISHTAGRYASKRFRKAQCPIVERLTNSLMMNGRNNGKKLKAVRIVKHTLEIINVLTDQNPLQVLVDAVVNTGPREDATRVGSSGTVRRQAVDVSPLRRVNQAIALLTIGAREASFRNIKTIAECLAEELINAAKGSSTSYAIKKKDELERVAKSNR